MARPRYPPSSAPTPGLPALVALVLPLVEPTPDVGFPVVPMPGVDGDPLEPRCVADGAGGVFGGLPPETRRPGTLRDRRGDHRDDERQGGQDAHDSDAIAGPQSERVAPS
jgi:hypothetical protein